MALHGVVVHRADGAGPSVVAARWLARLGARVTDSAGVADVAVASGVDRPPASPCALLVGDPVGDVPGLPAATLTYANGVALAGAAVLALLCGADVRADRRRVAAEVLLPLVLAAATGTEPHRPVPPRRIGDGYVQADLATDEDAEAFERLLASLGPHATDPHAVADEAQVWRLPVCAYEAHPPAAALPPDVAGLPPTADAGRPAPLAGMVVCDLTAMWAGPLATALLVAAGAEVHKVEPAARVDGTRGTPLYGAVNAGKAIHDLDATADRDELAALVRGSHLVVDSFSRRVMPNLGLAPDRLSGWGVASLSLPAFPTGHRWQLALGPGVHAASGLGDLGHGCVTTAVVAYPDPLAGLAAFATAAAMLRAGIVEHREVALFEPVAELAADSPPSPTVAERDADLGRRFVDDLDRPLFAS